ncbi:MAG: glycosyl transferase, partial [Betaproteobacteria bacterium]
MKLTYPGVRLSTSCVRTEIRLGWALLVVTAAVTGLLGWELTDTAARFLRNEDWAAAAGHLVFMGIVAALLYGSVVYQLTRIGGFQRRATFAPATYLELSRTYHEAAGKLVVLVPSYKEEVKVVRRTLMSAALQDYPRRRVVLLIDDPPAPQDSAEAATLQAMRALPESLRQLFDAAAQPFVAALAQFKARAESTLDLASETRRLASLHRLAARWCLLQEAGFAAGDSGDLLFRELVLRKAAQAHLTAAASIKGAARRGGVDRTRLQLEYHRLARRFRVRLGSFERKRYANLSHEPNKAMNLNSYLGLMGACHREVHRADGVHLQRAEAGIRFEDAEFVITLDADSMTSPDYALRLIHELRQSGNARVAVAQTPYSSLPARSGTIEYVAGATTDIQYLIHQGFTRYRATYWVGANALLRKAALEDIVVTQMERGFPVKVYIQDRTVIEDTESSIDLINRGWQLYNYPERLAFSATPADFG